MVPMFAALNRPNYHKLLPRHLADLFQAPPEIISALSEGGFTASISGRFYHDVALDEAHEMLINKDMKKGIHPANGWLPSAQSFLSTQSNAISTSTTTRNKVQRLHEGQV